MWWVHAPFNTERSEVLIHAITRTNLANILSERSHHKTPHIGWFHLVGNSIETESRLMFARGLADGNRDWFVSPKFLCWNLTPNVIVIRSEDWGVLKSRILPFTNRINPLIRDWKEHPSPMVLPSFCHVSERSHLGNLPQTPNLLARRAQTSQFPEWQEGNFYVLAN
jgi:hypothetical protein